MFRQSSPLKSQDLNTASGGTGPSSKKQRTQTAEDQGNLLHDQRHGDERVDHDTQQCASADGQKGSQGQASPQLTEDFDSMTDTVKAGIYMLQARTQAVDEKIEELIEVGAQYLEDLKQQFIEKMQGVKAEMHNYHDSQIQDWSAASAATTDAAVRLHHAKQLVESLGLQAIKT